MRDDERHRQHVAYFANREQLRFIEPRHCDLPITFEHPVEANYCQRAQAGIYSVPSLAPLTNKVSQVEMEAGDCEGRLPPLFLLWPSCPWSLVFGFWCLGRNT